MAHMEVLLREDVDNLGHRGQIVRVRSGYGRNYLLPQGLAIEATLGNKRKIEEERRILTKRESKEKIAAQTQYESLNGLELRFERKVGEHGVLYGSVGAHDIVEAFKERGFEVERRRISLQEPLKKVGEYDITIKLHREVSPVVKIIVSKEGGEEEPVATAQEDKASEAPPGAPESISAESTATDESDTAEA